MERLANSKLKIEIRHCSCLCPNKMPRFKLYLYTQVSNHTQCYCFFIYSLDFESLPHLCLSGDFCLLPARHVCLSSFLWLPPSRQRAVSPHSHHEILVLFWSSERGVGPLLLFFFIGTFCLGVRLPWAPAEPGFLVSRSAMVILFFMQRKLAQSMEATIARSGGGSQARGVPVFLLLPEFQ